MRGWLTLIGSQIDVFVAIDASFNLGSTWGKRLFGLRPAKLPPVMSQAVGAAWDRVLRIVVNQESMNHR